MKTPSPELLEPLVRFRSEAGAEFEAVSGAEIPEPARTLLVHQGDMTSRLQRFHESAIGLRVLQSTREGSEVCSREVLLLSEATGAPVEYGAIEIFLGGLPAAVRELILEGKVPLGGILNSSGVRYRSEPQEFFKLRQSPSLASLLGAESVTPLYGRCNILRTEDGGLLARIVEVLPNESLTPTQKPMMPIKNQYDVIVIGGGPAGATASALLAQKGRSVLLLEKEQFPRYHVGESLMPFCWFSLSRLGVLEEMEKIAFTKKYSVQFVTPEGRRSQPFYFFQHLDHPAAKTWQVERSEFDLMLLNNARKQGVEVHELTRVERVLKNDSGAVVGVCATGADGRSFEAFAPITIDCSGREQVATLREGWRVRDPKLNKIAVWTLYRGAKRDPGIDEGNTTVAYVPDRGWFWYIPLRGNVVSVGIVAEQKYLFNGTKDPAEIMTREIGNNAWIAEYLAEAEQFGEYWVTGEYSYRSRNCASDGLLLAGDAFAFLDPVFSSGVFLALKSGEMAADAVDAALSAGTVSGSFFQEYGERLCESIENMRNLVYAFYDRNFSFADMLRKYPEMRGKLTDCLIGDVDGKDYSDLFACVAEFADLPEPLSHGRAPKEALSA
jgi:flavin-dependent dehydrogenase/chorismate-pyruvate lyase